MNAKRVGMMLIVVLVFFVMPGMPSAGWLGFGSVEARGQTVAPPPVPDQELPAGSEVLTSGPVHEAFAEPVTLQAQAGVVAPKPPPGPIQEVPPAQRPEGANVVWIPGYWAWDTDRNDYIWVSGCWRVAPPSMYWVPGYWSAVAGGWEWVAGFWSPVSEQAQQIEYLPEPPATTDLEPQGEPPIPNDTWVPGCWYWYQGRYVERHGYWLTPHAGWVWGPAHYTWTPRGYVFCAGHWDYTLNQRGVLLAPVYFPPAVQVRGGYAYSPSICVDLGALTINLFTYPRYNHYYFGDFYDDAYLRLGIFPWFECETNHTWYDPVFEYDRWYLHQIAPSWEVRERHEYDLRRADRSLRPARTWTEMQSRQARVPAAEQRYFRTAEPINTFVERKTQPLKFQQIDNTERQRIAVQSTQVHEFRQQRNAWEAPAKGPTPAPAAAEHRGPTTTAPIPAHTQPMVTAPTHPTQPTPTPAEHRGPAETAPTRTAPPAPAPAHTPPVATAPAEHRGPAETAPTHTAPPAPATAHVAPTEHKAAVEPQRPAFVPARPVQATQPERVTIPSPPVVAKPVERTVEKAMPSHPTEEHSHVTPSRETPAPRTETRPAPESRPAPTTDGKQGTGTDGKQH